ncbi:tetratricopeptide repeat protein [Actinoallomurus rhizosphaericola]|uniref:tetratricopeptide repeat protein n=1 Tax=Actinoallomurus rhizosphaericola TaxID=2952536 RepID=UPI002093C98E|nr:tetratricopeptide repeat protein [Actinoallomurus rhizosphaericola]MCO5996232.1 tetratricopeptide repeat protein [Actinoallomurus rhizosphaericola]
MGGSVRVGGDNEGIISTGPGATNIQAVLPAEALRPVDQVDAVPGLSNVPAGQHDFVGRSDELADLEEALAGAGPVVVAAVHGLGGVGKSTLTARYAAAHAGRLNPVWWVTADTAASLQAGLAALTVGLQPELAAVLPLEALAERAVGWLACHTGWLLVLDNVTDPADVAPVLARARSGRVVVTSRLGEGWHRLGARTLRLDVLAEEHAVDLLTRIAARDRPGADLDGAAELVRELGCLPLAVEQAAAYLHQNHLSPRAYLQLLAEHPAVMYDQAALGADSERTIARIWRLTLDRLAETPQAADLLRTLAWYAPEQIPRTLLTGLTDPPALQQALGALAAYNLITLNQAGVTVHRLVQAVARTIDPGDPHRRPDAVTTALHEATRLLREAIPDQWREPSTWPQWRALAPHIDAVADRTPTDDQTTTLADLLFKTGGFHFEQGALDQAINYRTLASNTFARLLGEDHPKTLDSRTTLAYAYEAAGDLGRAISLFEAAVADCARVLGEDEYLTLASRIHLASAYHHAGDLRRAIPLLEAALADCLRVLDEDDYLTLGARNNLAYAYRDAGDLGRAIPLFEATAADCARVLGEDHADTLTARNNVAFVYQDAGDLGRAIPLFKANLADCVRVFGEDKPQTLASRNYLALAYEDAGDLERAIPLFEATLAARTRVLSKDHPDTLASQLYLAGAYQSAGDLEQAIPLLEETLADCVRVLGEDRPQTLGSRNNLACAYRDAGDLGRAIPLFEMTLADCVRVLGEDHPDTLLVRHHLALTYEAAGDLGRAIPLFESTLADCVRVLGEDHPETGRIRRNLESAARR